MSSQGKCHVKHWIIAVTKHIADTLQTAQSQHQVIFQIINIYLLYMAE